MGDAILIVETSYGWMVGVQRDGTRYQACLRADAQPGARQLPHEFRGVRAVSGSRDYCGGHPWVRTLASEADAIADVRATYGADTEVEIDRMRV